MSDGWLDVVSTLGDVEPPIDLWTDVIAREARIAPRRRWSNRPKRALVVALVAAGCITVLGLLAIAAHSHSSQRAPVGGHGGTLTLGQAIAVARKDGFQAAASHGRQPLRCNAHGFIMGNEPVYETRRGLDAAAYVVRVTDPRLHTFLAQDGEVVRPSLMLVMLDSSRQATVCAEDGITYQQHYDQVESGPGGTTPWTMFSPITVDLNPHSPRTRGFVPGTTGAYFTYLARGGLLAAGQTYNRRQAAIAEADLQKLAEQITGPAASSAK